MFSWNCGLRMMNKHLKYYKAGRRLLKDSFSEDGPAVGSLAGLKKYYQAGCRLLDDPCFQDGQAKNRIEELKEPKRTEIINFLLSQSGSRTCYLEIGVRDPEGNYNHIVADQKYSVDPGVEFEANPVDFKETSDDFFRMLSAGEILSPDLRFDVIFIDGLHLAEQVDRDIVNSLKYIKDDGFVVLHDCNPPTEWHARENYRYHHTPAARAWNGTTWKAFMKWRSDASVHSCCIDSDWGVGILSKTRRIGQGVEDRSPFYEFSKFSENRKEFLNLIDFDELKALLGQK